MPGMASLIVASLEAIPQNLAKMKIGTNFRQLYLPMPFTGTLIFLVEQIDLMVVSNFIIHCVTLRAFLKIRDPTCQIFVIADHKNSHNGRNLKLVCIFFYIKTHLFISVIHGLQFANGMKNTKVGVARTDQYLSALNRKTLPNISQYHSVDTLMQLWELLFHFQMLWFHLVLKGLGNLSG